MSEAQYLHHYTNINTLALILKNRTIRFNRLDHVDDIEESRKYGEYNLSRYLFVSCWTDDEESIPLWYMYSKGMTGVRISLPIDPFDYKPLVSNPELHVKVIPPASYFLTVEEMYTSEYIVNGIAMMNKDHLIKRVEYLDEDTLAELRNQAVQDTLDDNARGTATVAGPAKLAGYKSKKWKFQAEVRYVLMAFPSPPSFKKDPSSNWVADFAPYVLYAIKNDIGINKDFFDIPIAPSAMEKIRVTLAPLATDSDYLVVDALLHRYAKNGVLCKSNFAGTIRNPLR